MVVSCDGCEYDGVLIGFMYEAHTQHTVHTYIHIYIYLDMYMYIHILIYMTYYIYTWMNMLDVF